MPLPLGIDKLHVKVQQCRRLDKGGVDVSRRKYQRSVARNSQRDQGKHSLYCESRALGGIEAVPRAVKGAEIILTLPYYSVSGIQHVSPRDLSDIKCLNSKLSHALVTGHMETRRLALGISFYKIKNRCCHSSAFAMFNITAHSIRFLNSSQPYLYTPPIEPVAW